MIEPINDNPSPIQIDKSVQKTEETNALDFAKLTHQNWLFINAFLSTGSIQKAYQLAKYEGRDASAPYQIFKKLKTYIEQIGDLDITSRARLQADIKGVLDIPLVETKALSLKDWLAVRKFSASITPEAREQRPQISVLVINRKQANNNLNESIGNNEKGNTSKPIDTRLDSETIIEADVIPNDL